MHGSYKLDTFANEMQFNPTDIMQVSLRDDYTMKTPAPKASSQGGNAPAAPAMTKANVFAEPEEMELMFETTHFGRVGAAVHLVIGERSVAVLECEAAFRNSAGGNMARE